jgi:CDP-glucose 4,6-dehydratase
MEACRIGETVKRVVVASSDKAYGTHDKLPYTEDYSLNGLFPYDASKACTDVIARSFAHTYDTPVAVTRFANIYGPGDMNMSRIIPGTIVSILKNENPIIRSDGTPKRDFMYVDDVARAYLMLAENIEKTKGEAFNFGSGAPVQMLDLVQRIVRLAGKEGVVEPDILLKTKIAREIDEQYLGAEKAARVLNWKAAFDLDSGLTHTINWYAENLDKVI